MILSNFNGKEVNLKPCVCGNTNFIIEHDISAGMHVCSIGCTDMNCLYIVDQIGYSKENALDKAIKVWNENDNIEMV